MLACLVITNLKRGLGISVLQYKERWGLLYQNMMDIGVLIMEMYLGTMAGRDYHITMYYTSRMVVMSRNGI